MGGLRLIAGGPLFVARSGRGGEGSAPPRAEVLPALGSRHRGEREGLSTSTGRNERPAHWRFMTITRDEVVALGGTAKRGEGLLKRLDEFNYCRSQGWL